MAFWMQLHEKNCFVNSDWIFFSYKQFWYSLSSAMYLLEGKTTFLHVYIHMVQISYIPTFQPIQFNTAVILRRPRDRSFFFAFFFSKDERLLACNWLKVCWLMLSLFLTEQVHLNTHLCCESNCSCWPYLVLFTGGSLYWLYWCSSSIQ